MSERDRLSSALRERWQNLSREQRLSIIVMSACGVVALGLSVAQMRAQVVNPFFVSKGVLKKTQAFYREQEETRRAEERLQTADTDHDGLNDYSELNQYHTSPYLSDSDSDGQIDSVELAQRTDPNCPKGRTCSEEGDWSERFNSASGTRVGPALSAVEGVTSGSAIGIPQPPQVASDGSLSAGEVRSYLLSMGAVSEEQLGGLSDEELLSIYRRAFAEAQRSRLSEPSLSHEILP